MYQGFTVAVDGRKWFTRSEEEAQELVAREGDRLRALGVGREEIPACFEVQACDESGWPLPVVVRPHGYGWLLLVIQVRVA